MRRRVLFSAVLCVLAVAAGCTTGPRSSGGSAGPSLDPVAGDVRLAYLAYWDAWLKANVTSNPDEPALTEHTASPQLDIVRANLTAARQRNQVAKGTVDHRLVGMERDVEDRRVVDCVDLDRWLLYDAFTDKQIDQLIDKPSQLAIFTLKRRGGTWQVTSLRVAGEC
jgi:hypothetical protein